MIKLSRIVDELEMVNDIEVKNNLQRLIQGKGAFRRFKNYCIENNIIQNWYDFRRNKLYEIATKWCKDNDLEFDSSK